MSTREIGIALLLVVVVVYAFSPWVIPSEAVLSLSVQRVHPASDKDQPVYFVWHLQNRGPFPIRIKDAVWSLVGYPWEDTPYPSTEPPLTDLTLMPFGEYSYMFQIVEKTCLSVTIAPPCITQPITPTRTVMVSLRGTLQISLATKPVALFGDES